MTVGNTLANEVFLENCDDMTCRVATNFLKFIQKNVLLIVLCSLLNCVEEKKPFNISQNARHLHKIR